MTGEGKGARRRFVDTRCQLGCNLIRCTLRSSHIPGEEIGSAADVYAFRGLARLPCHRPTHRVYCTDSYLEAKVLSCSYLGTVVQKTMASFISHLLRWLRRPGAITGPTAFVAQLSKPLTMPPRRYHRLPRRSRHHHCRLCHFHSHRCLPRYPPRHSDPLGFPPH